MTNVTLRFHTPDGTVDVLMGVRRPLYAIPVLDTLGDKGFNLYDIYEMSSTFRGGANYQHVSRVSAKIADFIIGK